MRIYFTERALTQARAHQVLEGMRKFTVNRLTRPYIGRYIYKEVKNKHFLTIGQNLEAAGQEVFVWLAVLHRNSRQWTELCGDPARFGARVFEPILESEKARIEEWLHEPDALQEAPALPDYLRPWFQPLSLTSMPAPQEIQVYETSVWVQQLNHPDVSDRWETLKDVLFELVEQPRPGRPIEDSLGFFLHGFDGLHVVFAHLKMGQTRILLLVSLFLSPHPPTAETVREAIINQRGLAGLVSQSEVLTHDLLARHTRRTWPAYFLADRETWRKVVKDDASNLTLSAEEESVLEALTGVTTTSQPEASNDENIHFPCFLDGRAGSGKSTILMYVFAKYCARKLKDGWEGIPLYVTLNDQLLKKARETVVGMLTNNASLMNWLGSMENGAISEVSDWFFSFHDLLRSLLVLPGSPVRSAVERFPGDRFVSLHRFKRLYLGRDLSKEDRPFALFWRGKNRISADAAWFVIRAIIKGSDEEQWLPLDAFDALQRKDKPVSRHDFELIHEHVWEQWYRKLMEEHGLWDSQDLVRAVLNDVPELPEHTLICCDEAQDLTRIEARLLFRLSVASRYPLPKEHHTHLPVLYAGDPLQTVNPSGFRWAALKQIFDDEIRAVLDPERALSQTSLAFRTLHHNYRSTRQIVSLLNIIHAWRSGEDELKASEPQQGWSAEEGVPPILFIVEEQLTAADVEELLRDTVILVPAEEHGEGEYAKQDPLLSVLCDASDEPHNVFSAATFKGLEAPKVVVYGFGQSAPEGTVTEPFSEENPDIERQHFWTRLYVALSRATRYLFVVDTKEGVERLWRHFQDELTQPPHVSNDLWARWCANGAPLQIGSDHEKQFMREPEPLKVARLLKERGSEGNNPVLLRKAAGYFSSLSLTTDARRCEAMALELEGRFVEAGECWQDLGCLEQAVSAFWKGLAWRPLMGVATKGVFLTEEQQLVASFLAPLGTPGAASHDKRQWLAAVREFLPKLTAWLQAGGKPSPLSPQWLAVVRALKPPRQKADEREEFTENERRQLALVAEALSKLGHSTQDLAVKYWFLLRNWTGVVRISEASGRTNHPSYYRAKAEVTPAPERLGWWRKANDFQRIVDYWQSNRTYDEAWKEDVLVAMDRCGLWKEKIEASLRFPRALELAAKDLIQHNLDLKPAERKRLNRKISHAIVRRRLWRTAGELIRKLPALESDPIQARRIQLELSAMVARQLLEDHSEGLPPLPSTVKEQTWWREFVDGISKDPDGLYGLLSIEQQSRLLGLSEDKEGVERFLIKTAARPGSPFCKEAAFLLKKLGETETSASAPDVVEKHMTVSDSKAASSAKERSEGMNGSPTHKTSMSQLSQATPLVRPEDAPPSGPVDKGLDLSNLEVQAIEEMRLKNFRAYANACLRLDDFTILIGKNGAGKSSLRDALDIMREALTDKLTNAISRRGGMEACIRQSGSGRESSLALSVQIRLKAADEVFRVVYGIELLLDDAGGHRVFAEQFTCSHPAIPGFRRDGEVWQVGIDVPQPTFASDQLVFPLLAESHPVWSASYKALTQLRTYLLSPAEIGEETPALDEGRLEFPGSNAANVLRRLERQHPAALEAVHRYLSAIVPGLIGIRTETRRGKRSLIFRQQGARELDLDSTQMSEGTLRCVGILLALFQRPAPTLVLIEELEDSVHPGALAALMEAIEEALRSTQVVITSHSPTALMAPSATRARTRVIQWELGQSDIYALESPPLKSLPLEADDYPFSVGELLQANAMPVGIQPCTVRGSFFEVEVLE